jgi:hypothetical protein
MVEQSENFKHVSLELAKKGLVTPTTGGGRRREPRTQANFDNRGQHGNQLKSSTLNLISTWEDTKEKRKEEGKPDLPPDSIPLILRVDPIAFDAEGLKQYGIEVIAELEDGYIIGASVDSELTDLQKKIDLFINEERGGKKVAEVWDLLDDLQGRPQYILSPELQASWDQVQDGQLYIVDVGVACVGPTSQLPSYPKREKYISEEKYQIGLERWDEKKCEIGRQWDDLAEARETKLYEFVAGYDGSIISNVEGDTPTASHLPDSFTCRIKISGIGLKDLVLNFPYVFDVSESDEFSDFLEQGGRISDEEEVPFRLESPPSNAPRICIIDSGIQERHPLLKSAVDSSSSRSWVPGEKSHTADYVDGGHGTRVAGAVLYPRNVPRNGEQTAVGWLQNARVLDANCQLSERLFPPDILSEIVNIYHRQTKTRIFNHSITGSVPCRIQYMSAWASSIDLLSWQHDILFIVSAGNLPRDGYVGVTRFSVQEHLANSRQYPEYLLEDSCRIANPAQSFQALTVGSVALSTYDQPLLASLSKEDHPSAFSCSGLGIWKTIKPEVVEYGGDLTKDTGNPPNLTQYENVCPELVRSTLKGGPAIAQDQVGTSYAAPKVSHIAARLANEFPNESCLLYRALIVQSARWPAWTTPLSDSERFDALRQIGYGIPSVERALGNSPSRITLITKGIQMIKAREAHVYRVRIPERLLSQGDELEILLEITLSYKAQPRRTRRNRRKYLSTWLDWDCSKRGEDPEHFLQRILSDYDAFAHTDGGEGLFTWTLGKQNNHRTLRDVSRSAGTLQKDWAVVKSFELREAFCVAVIGHQGWNNDPEAQAPYSLVVSFEALGTEVPLYAEFVEAQQIGIKIEEQVQIVVNR